MGTVLNINCSQELQPTSRQLLYVPDSSILVVSKDVSSRFIIAVGKFPQRKEDFGARNE
jgi:hypothetical protein